MVRSPYLKRRSTDLRTLPLGNVGFENNIDEDGRLLNLARPFDGGSAVLAAGCGRKLFRCDFAHSGEKLK